MGFLKKITPLILTFNEAPNIARILEKLDWASDVVVVDSFSDDQTVEILNRFDQVRMFQRRFDSHARQWSFGLEETGIETEWVLALDADYVLSDALVEELKGLEPQPQMSGYQARFRYCVFGRPLRGSLYPPVTVLYRRKFAGYEQDGHTQRVVVNGVVESLNGFILHDDRKSLSHWLRAQDRYMRLEAENIAQKPWSALRIADRIRKLVWPSPFVVLFYCLFVKGTIFDGRAGLYYSFQRALAEFLLSLHLLEDKDQAASTVKQHPNARIENSQE